MARKYNKNTPFAYRITLIERDTYDDRFKEQYQKRVVVDTIAWKEKALERIMVYFVHQIGRMKQQIRRPWYCYYEVIGYGAPREKEFLCYYTAMRARTIKPQRAIIYRQYYARCIRFSEAILEWLFDLDTYEYTFELHLHLIRYLVYPRPTDDRFTANQRRLAIMRANRNLKRNTRRENAEAQTEQSSEERLESRQAREARKTFV